MTMRLPPSVKLPAFPLKSPTSPNFGIYFLTFKLYSMQLTNDAVSTTTRGASIISTSFEFRTYLVSMPELKLCRSAVQKIPFLANPSAGPESIDSAIWIGTSIKKAYGLLKTQEQYNELALSLRAEPTKYAIGIIADKVGGKTSWVLYIKGENQAEVMATIKMDSTANATAVATVS